MESTPQVKTYIAIKSHLKSYSVCECGEYLNTNITNINVGKGMHRNAKFSLSYSGYYNTLIN